MKPAAWRAAVLGLCAAAALFAVAAVMDQWGAWGAALVCGPKLDGESYAPDESDALLALAQGVGAALGALRADTDRESGQVLRELAALRADAKRILGMLPGSAT